MSMLRARMLQPVERSDNRLDDALGRHRRAPGASPAASADSASMRWRKSSSVGRKLERTVEPVPSAVRLFRGRAQAGGQRAELARA